MRRSGGVPAATVRGAARLFAIRGNVVIYYGLGGTEHSQGSIAVMGISNPAMATGNIGRRGVRVNLLRSQDNVRGCCDMGSFPQELAGYRHVSTPTVGAIYEAEWGIMIDPKPNLRIPNILDAAVEETFLRVDVQGEDIVCVIENSPYFEEINICARVLLPAVTFLEKDDTFINTASTACARLGRHVWHWVNGR